MTTTTKLPVGTKVKLANERQRYVVQASSDRYAVCTKPLNAITRLGNRKYRHTKTVLYTILDFEENVRGTENLVFGMGAETREDCEDMLKRLTVDDPMNERSEVSHRNRVTLNIEAMEFPKDSGLAFIHRSAFAV